MASDMDLYPDDPRPSEVLLTDAQATAAGDGAAARARLVVCVHRLELRVQLVNVVLTLRVRVLRERVGVDRAGRGGLGVSGLPFYGSLLGVRRAARQQAAAGGPTFCPWKCMTSGIFSAPLAREQLGR